MALKDFGIETASAKDITEDHVKSFAKQAGVQILGALSDFGLLQAVGESFNISEVSEHMKLFEEELLSVLRMGLKRGVPGLEARAKMSHELAEMAKLLRQNSVELAINSQGKGSEDTVAALSGLFGSAEESERISKALFDPIRRNLENLIHSGRNIIAMQEAARAEEAKQQDAEHDSGCDDPECGHHLNH